MNARIDRYQGEIADLCRRWQVTELALFGSILRDDFGPHSDIDVLVSFAPGTRRTLTDIIRMQDELSGVLGRPTELVERSAVEASRNYIRRAEILQSAEAVYAA